MQPKIIIHHMEKAKQKNGPLKKKKVIKRYPCHYMRG
jgi:hypothetical protein